MIQPPPRSVVELPRFVADAARLMTDEEREGFIAYIAEHPEAGDVMQGTGGFRKVRWAVGGRGKSAGVRVVYYFVSDENVPLLLLSAFAKNEKANLNKAERNALRELAPNLLAAFRKGD